MTPDLIASLRHFTEAQEAVDMDQHSNIVAEDDYILSFLLNYEWQKIATRVTTNAMLVLHICDVVDRATKRLEELAKQSEPHVTDISKNYDKGYEGD